MPSRWWRAWLARRNRWLASPRFQRFAARFVLTRPVARRNTRALFDLCAGFVYSQVLFACVRLELFERLTGAPRHTADLAAELAMPTAACRRLLEAAASLCLLERVDTERYTLGALGAAMLGNPAVAAMVSHHDRLYADLADPLALLRGDRAHGALARYWSYAAHAQPASLAAPRITDYTELMARSQAMIAAQVLDAYPLTRHRHLLDVGGGDGGFAIAAVRAAPGLSARVFDLPAVIARANARIAAAGLDERIRTVAGDFRANALPTGADIVSLIRIVHDHDDEAALGLLRAVHRGLAAGGRLLLAEPMADTPGAEPVGAAYFGFYLWAMGQGRPRTADELENMLRAAGFARIRRPATHTPLLVRILLAERD